MQSMTKGNVKISTVKYWYIENQKDEEKEILKCGSN
jgi:hypothetical protein